MHHGPSIQLGADTVPACDHVRLLGVIISADLSLDRHVSIVSSASFYWLRQLRRVRRSLNDESAATLVHAFVTSRVDYCNLLLAGALKSVTDKLQRVMNAAAQVVFIHWATEQSKHLHRRYIRSTECPSSFIISTHAWFSVECTVGFL